MSAPASWMIEPRRKVSIFLATENRCGGNGRTRTRRLDRTFAAIAQADGKTLSWTMGSDRVEITSATNVLTQSGKGALWAYHDPQFRSQDQPNAVRLQAADTVEWLLPKR